MTKLTLREILRHHHEFADMAWSEVTDKVQTVEEYQKAYKKLTEQHVAQIQALIDEAYAKGWKDALEEGITL